MSGVPVIFFIILGAMEYFIDSGDRAAFLITYGFGVFVSIPISFNSDRNYNKSD
jgi:hypothetical protein